MKKVSIHLNCIILIPVILFLVLMAGTAKAQLVTNGGFESSDTGIIDSTNTPGWLMQVAGGVSPAPVFEIVSDSVKRGNRAIKVTVDGVGTNQWDIQIVADSIPAIPGDTYIYTIWAKAESAGAQVNFTMGNYSFNEYGAIRPANLTTQWQKYTLQFTVNDNQTIIRAPIHFNYAGNSNNAIYIDDLRILHINANKIPVIVEAESGELGSFFSVTQDGDITYTTTTSNFIGQAGPGDSTRVGTYQVTFQDSGYYNLFGRVRVGAGGFDDDSFFYGRGFGEKNDTASADWVLINGLASAGFSNPSDIVDEAGGVGSEIWKWVNLTKNTYSGAPGDSFYVSLDSLTKTFQMGSREDGLHFDKFAFGTTNLVFTVENLDSVQPGSVPSAGEVWGGPPLASNQPKFVGNIHSSSQINNFEAYWNAVIPENSGKWGSVEGTRDVMNWGGLDAAYDLAKDNGFPFNFHVLLWGAQQPGWINDLSNEEQIEEITEWFEAVAERYPDIDYLQVVNEPLVGHNPPDGQNGRANYKDALGGDGATGYDWVITAFRMAREIFPDTKLMINDFNIINNSGSTTTYLNIINNLKKEDLIDVIGVQGHAFTTTAPSVTLRNNLTTLGTSGLPIQVTELDIDGPTDQIQLQDYRRIFPVLYEHPSVEGIVLWGWRPGLWRNDQGAFIINSDGSERPALVWLRDYLDSVDVTVGVETAEDLPKSYRLYNNYPNPFNPTTTISWQTPEGSWQTLKIYDVLGNEVATLVDEFRPAGRYEVKFDASKLSSGMYIYQLNTGNFTETKKLVLLK